MVFTIGGVDILPYIKEDGIKWQRNDVDSPGTGRTMNAAMHRSRVAIKTRLDISCRPLTTEEARIVLQAILPVFVTVRYDDPMSGTVVTKTMYSNNVPATSATIYPDGTALWKDITFPLVER